MVNYSSSLTERLQAIFGKHSWSLTLWVRCLGGSPSGHHSLRLKAKEQRTPCWASFLGSLRNPMSWGLTAAGNINCFSLTKGLRNTVHHSCLCEWQAILVEQGELRVRLHFFKRLFKSKPGHCLISSPGCSKLMRQTQCLTSESSPRSGGGINHSENEACPWESRLTFQNTGHQGWHMCV